MRRRQSVSHRTQKSTPWASVESGSLSYQTWQEWPQPPATIFVLPATLQQTFIAPGQTYQAPDGRTLTTRQADTARTQPCGYNVHSCERGKSRHRLLLSHRVLLRAHEKSPHQRSAQMELSHSPRPQLRFRISSVDKYQSRVSMRALQRRGRSRATPFPTRRGGCSQDRPLRRSKKAGAAERSSILYEAPSTPLLRSPRGVLVPVRSIRTWRTPCYAGRLA
jgi:hypothetical protein